MATLVFFLALTGCVVGPDYKRPAVAIPPTWGWKLAEPGDEKIKGNWWEGFQDPVLNGLETEATTTNQLIQAAMARVEQSRAVARMSASAFSPQLDFDPSITSFHTELNHVPSELTATSYTMPLDLSYEVDLWGKIRRAFQAAHADAQASTADYYNVLLMIHGDVAVNYFLLRQLDTQIQLWQRTVELRQKSVDIVTERYQGGLAAELDVERAKTELDQVRTQWTEAQRQRDDLQNALALLCGQPAPSFQIKPASFNEVLPSIPVELPSSLLERRPDIAEAERKMMAANAQIGVAKAAFFPAISLTGDAGYSSFHVSTLFDWESQLFQIGPSATMPLLNGGRLRAGLREARAEYEATCAGYRQQVLAAFKDVSDSMVDVKGYRQEASTEAAALADANRAADSARERYQQGLVNYLEVLDAEQTQLEVNSQSIRIEALQLVASVHLIKALGGGFAEDSGSGSNM
ncbi:MAG TPA: efflux transporter outer membrane subunit [Verrucomicrobiae bacterium]